jgi:microsomal dipeptidase-like Zn-dependent dipeptidase
MKILDLHFHPSYKIIFSHLYTPWENIPAKDVLIGKIIRSQGNLTQTTDNPECNLLCISVYPPEIAFVSDWLVKVMGPGITNGLDPLILTKMINETFTYPLEIEEEITSLSLLFHRKGVHMLKSFQEYQPTDFSKLYVLFSVEGGHAFYGANQNNHSDIKLILESFSKFLKSEFLVFYITPCHLTPNIFMTHAYGNKLLGKGEFIPINKGITPEGCQFLDRIASEGLLTDVKHMSVVSRQEYYKNRQDQKPILSSHAGVTGISWLEKLDRNKAMFSIKKGPRFKKVRYIKPRGILKRTLFNPCSINLYNEDIREILLSNGLIGISMDLRIIGGDRTILDAIKLNEKEFVSHEEFEIWTQQIPGDMHLVDTDFEEPYKSDEINEDIWDDEDRQDEFEELNTIGGDDIDHFYSKSAFSKKGFSFFFRDRSDEHLRHFVNQIFHIIKVAEFYQLKNGWEHICIGSDFDGFIRTIDCCDNAGRLTDFANTLIQRLPALANEAHIPLPKSPQQVVENIFFNNCYHVMKKHFR